MRDLLSDIYQRAGLHLFLLSYLHHSSVVSVNMCQGGLADYHTWLRGTFTGRRHIYSSLGRYLDTYASFSMSSPPRERGPIYYCTLGPEGRGACRTRCASDYLSG